MINDCSIIICSCNYGHLIARAIRSALNQHDCEPEVIVVDDASTDNTREMLNPFIAEPVFFKVGELTEKEIEEFQAIQNDPTAKYFVEPGQIRQFRDVAVFHGGVVYIRNPKNVGVAESANIGIRASTKQYVMRLDADDYIATETCFILRTFLAQNLNHFAVSCDYFLVEGGCGDEQKMTRKCALEDPIACGVMYRRDILLEFGGYERGRRYKEVEELHKRIGDKFKIGHIHITLYRYQMHKFNKTKEQAYKEATI